MAIPGIHLSDVQLIRRELDQIFSKLKRNTGQGLLEYALILVLISLAVFTTLRTLGITLDTGFYEPVNVALKNILE